MFGHVYKYVFLTTLRSKEMLFWMLIFPIILSSLFSFAFSELLAGEGFKTVKVAVIENEEFNNNQMFKETLKNVSKEENTDRLLDIEYTNIEEAENLLKNNEIAGYIKIENNIISFITAKSEIEQTIVKSFLDDYIQTSSAVTNIIEKKPMALQEGIIEELANRTDYLKTISYGTSEPNTIVIYFYTVIAMICFFASELGLNLIRMLQANLSTEACRNNMAISSKMKYFIAGTFAMMTVQILILTIVFVYLIFVLNIDFGSNLFLVILTSIIGSLCGFMFGSIIGSVSKIGATGKEAICVSTTLILCFLSGMMSVNVKYYIDTYVPVLKYLNPASLITDSLYSLYYYSTYTRIYTNLIILTIIALILGIITVVILRRQRYASV